MGPDPKDPREPVLWARPRTRAERWPSRLGRLQSTPCLGVYWQLPMAMLRVYRLATKSRRATLRYSCGGADVQLWLRLLKNYCCGRIVDVIL